MQNILLLGEQVPLPPKINKTNSEIKKFTASLWTPREKGCKQKKGHKQKKGRTQGKGHKQKKGRTQDFVTNTLWH